jgi:hypothetical protein
MIALFDLFDDMPRETIRAIPSFFGLLLCCAALCLLPTILGILHFLPLGTQVQNDNMIL